MRYPPLNKMSTPPSYSLKVRALPTVDRDLIQRKVTKLFNDIKNHPVACPWRIGYSYVANPCQSGNPTVDWEWSDVLKQIFILNCFQVQVFVDHRGEYTPSPLHCSICKKKNRVVIPEEDTTTETEVDLAMTTTTKKTSSTTPPAINYTFEFETLFTGSDGSRFVTLCDGCLSTVVFGNCIQCCDPDDGNTTSGQVCSFHILKKFAPSDMNFSEIYSDPSLPIATEDNEQQPQYQEEESSIPLPLATATTTTMEDVVPQVPDVQLPLCTPSLPTLVVDAPNDDGDQTTTTTPPPPLPQKSTPASSQFTEDSPPLSIPPTPPLTDDEDEDGDEQQQQQEEKENKENINTGNVKEEESSTTMTTTVTTRRLSRTMTVVSEEGMGLCGKRTSMELTDDPIPLKKQRLDAILNHQTNTNGSSM